MVTGGRSRGPERKAASGGGAAVKEQLGDGTGGVLENGGQCVG